jgi:hypothetical protein
MAKTNRRLPTHNVSASDRPGLSPLRGTDLRKDSALAARGVSGSGSRVLPLRWQRRAASQRTSNRAKLRVTSSRAAAPVDTVRRARWGRGRRLGSGSPARSRCPPRLVACLNPREKEIACTSEPERSSSFS